MDRPIFKLSSVLTGHASDVRAVATFADGTIVSASRDKTARVWKLTGDGKYVNTETLGGHDNFVSSVCVLNPSSRHPEGLIITGGNDNNICVYVPGQTVPIHTVEAHQNTVCKLRTGKKEGSFLSSSWDMSAKLWDTSDLSKPKLTFVGHTAAVWGVAELENGLIVTGSADKTITVWNQDGSIRHKLEGHTDCVRDIAALKQDEFLSCANDATVRHWNATNGTCLGTYCGHRNYIYGIIAVPDGSAVFTCSEDRTMIVWCNGELQQSINFPTQSVWCLDLIGNGDIVAGSSDGVLRIFSASPQRHADPAQLAQYEEEIAKTELNAEQELGGLKIKDLPDASVLSQPGQRDGQTKMVQEEGAVYAFSWSQSEGRWVKIGHVMGASGGSTATSGKQLYNGIEYDYVFSVDIQDGVPPLKLPYNNGQDPWHVAQKFLHDNDLSQLFLEQVANFIVKNTEVSPIVNSGEQYHDPFTGGSRYIPSSGSSSAPPQLEPVVSSSPSSLDALTSYVPHTTYLKLEQANLTAISEKLREINSRQNDELRVRAEQLDSVVKLVGGQVPVQLRSDAIKILRGLLHWPCGTVFPALDIARLAVLQKEVNDELCTDALFESVRQYLGSGVDTANQMLTFRLLANMFCHERGAKLCISYKNEIQEALLQLGSLGPKGNQIAISTYILNTVIELNKQDDTDSKRQFLNVIITILPKLNEAEAVFRSLVALGTLLSYTSSNQERIELITQVRFSETILNHLKTMSTSSVTTAASSKVANCAKQVIHLLT